MAKATAKKATTPVKKRPRQVKPENQSPCPVLSPERVHELLGLPAPFEPPPPPPAWPGYVTVWDCGCSIRDLRKKHPALFCPFTGDWLDAQEFAKRTNVRHWRQLKPLAAPPGLPFADQAEHVSSDDDLPHARELVLYLLVHFLATGERLPLPALRTKDVLPSGRRVIVGRFLETGLEIANVSDEWASPGIALAAVFTPPVKRK